MSAGNPAAIVLGTVNTDISVAVQRREAEVRASEGVTAPQGSTAPPPSVAAKNASGGGFLSGLSGVPKDFLNFASPVAGAGAGLAESAAGALGIPTPGSLASEVGEDLINAVKPIALKGTLYALFIIGGVAMMVFGVEQLLKPVGGPDLKSAARKGLTRLAVAE